MRAVCKMPNHTHDKAAAGWAHHPDSPQHFYPEGSWWSACLHVNFPMGQPPTPTPASNVEMCKECHLRYQAIKEQSK